MTFATSASRRRRLPQRCGGSPASLQVLAPAADAGEERLDLAIAVDDPVDVAERPLRLADVGVVAQAVSDGDFPAGDDETVVVGVVGRSRSFADSSVLISSFSSPMFACMRGTREPGRRCGSTGCRPRAMAVDAATAKPDKIDGLTKGPG